MKLKFKKNNPVKDNKVIKDYICLNGKKLSEQTINDYAQFIPKWDERIELGDDCYLVSCVHPHNHKHNDADPSMLISTGTTNRKGKVIVHCRLHNSVCSDDAILKYFLSRLTGEVSVPTSPVSVRPKKWSELSDKEKMDFSIDISLRKSANPKHKRRLK